MELEVLMKNFKAVGMSGQGRWIQELKKLILILHPTIECLDFRRSLDWSNLSFNLAFILTLYLSVSPDKANYKSNSLIIKWDSSSSGKRLISPLSVTHGWTYKFKT